MKRDRLKHIFFGKSLRSFTVKGMFKYLSLRVRGKDILIQGRCLGCGACCRSISLEGRSGWLRCPKEFQCIVEKYPEYNRFSVIGRDQQGLLLFSCSWSTSDGTCRDYGNRLPMCKNFPESSLAFCGGILLEKCGYSFIEAVPFKTILQREMKK